MTVRGYDGIRVQGYDGTTVRGYDGMKVRRYGGVKVFRTYDRCTVKPSHPFFSHKLMT
jgi:hypothetical protein